MAGVVLAGLVLFIGCNGFFVANSTTTTTSATYSYLYASNSTSGTTYLSGYNILSGALTPLSGFPTSLGYTPTAMAMAPGNGYLYIASPATSVSVAAIYGYALTSGTGALNILSNGQPLVNAVSGVSSMAISPGGDWLYTLDVTGQVLSEYAVSSSGLLTTGTTFQTPGTGCTVLTPCSITVAPSGVLVAASLGGAGDVIFQSTETSGISSQSYTSITPGTTTAGDFASVFDSNNRLYVARTTGELVFSLSTSGTGSAASGSPFAAGSSPRAVALNLYSTTTAPGYTFDANSTSGTIYAFSIGTGGVLAPVIGSPFAGPPNLVAMLPDTSAKYLVAAGYSASNGLQLFTQTDGVLATGASVATGTVTTVPMLIAVTH